VGGLGTAITEVATGDQRAVRADVEPLGAVVVRDVARLECGRVVRIDE